MKTNIAIRLAPVIVAFVVGSCGVPDDFFTVKSDGVDSITVSSVVLTASWVGKNKEEFQVKEVGFYYGKDDPPYPNGTWVVAPFPRNYDGWESNADFRVKVSNLEAFTTYFYQPYIKVENRVLTGISSRFTTEEPLPDAGTFTDDRNGKSYGWIRIGTQVWMAENLAWIPSIFGPDEGSTTQARYYIYGDDGSNQGQTPDTYGKYGTLYNWTAARTGCPDGWHLPTDVEWNTLTSYLAYPEGSKMKETGSIHWSAQNTDATNSSGFSARGGGQRYYLGGFMRLGTHAYFWTATEKDSTSAWDRSLQDTQNRTLRGNANKASGYSVRCIRN
jgi:uncharacterized protein (TIGR02145 family)